MRLYPKKLKSVADLEREKKLLRKETRQWDKDDFLSLGSLLGGGNKRKKKDKYKERPESFVDTLPVANPLIKFGLRILEGRIINGRKANRYNRYASDYKPRKNPVKTVAFEVLGGYLKWKAIELSYKGIQYLIKKRKEKKAHLERYEYKG